MNNFLFSLDGGLDGWWWKIMLVKILSRAVRVVMIWICLKRVHFLLIFDNILDRKMLGNVFFLYLKYNVCKEILYTYLYNEPRSAEEEAELSVEDYSQIYVYTNIYVQYYL